MDKITTKSQVKGKRQTIMESALELFFSKGYKNTKIIEIAELASIGKGTFYEYFKSKEALLIELLNTKFENDRQHIEKIAAEDLTGSEKIKSFILFEIECMKKYGPASNALAQEMMSPGFSTSAEIVGVMHKAFGYKYEFINKVIKESIKIGEFRQIDSTLASTGILGAVSFYTAFKFNMMNNTIIPGLPFENLDWKDDEFFHLIFSGLK